MQGQNFVMQLRKLIVPNGLNQPLQQVFGRRRTCIIRKGKGLRLFVHERPHFTMFVLFGLARGHECSRMVRPRRLELPRPKGHNDLNVARLPIPPRPHKVVFLSIPTPLYNEKRASLSFAKFLSPGLATWQQSFLMPMNK